MNNTREKITDGFYDITKTWFEADHNDSKEDNITVAEESGGQARVVFNLSDQIEDNIDNEGPDEDGYLVHPVDLNLQTQIHMGSTKVNKQYLVPLNLAKITMILGRQFQIPSSPPHR